MYVPAVHGVLSAVFGEKRLPDAAGNMADESTDSKIGKSIKLQRAERSCRVRLGFSVGLSRPSRDTKYSIVNIKMFIAFKVQIHITYILL